MYVRGTFSLPQEAATHCPWVTPSQLSLRAEEAVCVSCRARTWCLQWAEPKVNQKSESPHSNETPRICVEGRQSPQGKQHGNKEIPVLWVTSTRVSLSTARLPFSQENEGHSEVSNLDGHNAWSHEPDTGLGRPPPRRSLEPQNHRDIKCGRGAAISGAGWWGQLCETSCPEPDAQQQ